MKTPLLAITIVALTALARAADVPAKTQATEPVKTTGADAEKSVAPLSPETLRINRINAWRDVGIPVSDEGKTAAEVNAEARKILVEREAARAKAAEAKAAAKAAEAKTKTPAVARNEPARKPVPVTPVAATRKEPARPASSKKDTPTTGYNLSTTK